MIAHIESRPETPEDEPFLRRVFECARAAELELLPGNDEQRAAFLDLQFRAQRAHYHRMYPHGSFFVIFFEGDPIGYWVVNQTESIHLVDIALLPEYRGRGIGTQLIESLIRESEATGKAITLNVEQFSRARRLYERLRFVAEDIDGVYIRMRRTPL